MDDFFIKLEMWMQRLERLPARTKSAIFFAGVTLVMVSSFVGWLVASSARDGAFSQKGEIPDTRADREDLFQLFSDRFKTELQPTASQASQLQRLLESLEEGTQK